VTGGAFRLLRQLTSGARQSTHSNMDTVLFAVTWDWHDLLIAVCSAVFGWFTKSTINQNSK